jgi:thioesterase domain-containing protein
MSSGRPGGPSLYCVHGAAGTVENFGCLVEWLAPTGVRFVGVRALGVDGGPVADATIPAMAERYLAAVRRDRTPADGPVYLSGYSGGGVVAWHMAAILAEAGDPPAHLFLFDTLSPAMQRKRLTRLQKVWAARRWELSFALQWRSRRRAAGVAPDRIDEIARLLAEGKSVPPDLAEARLELAHYAAIEAHDPLPYAGDVTVFRARRAGVQYAHAGRALGWQLHASGALTSRQIDGDHFALMQEPGVAEIAQHIATVMGTAVAQSS